MSSTRLSPYRAVALLDRDGAINEEVDYLSDPSQLRLLPGAAEAIRILAAEGIACIVCTNQSGIARGYFTEGDLERIHGRLCELLAAEGGEVLGIHHCSAHPDAPDERRKPGPGMYHEAARAHGLFGIPVYAIGDRMTDVEFGINCGGKGIRVACGHPPEKDTAERRASFDLWREAGLAHASANLIEAAHWMLADLSRATFRHDLMFQRKFADLYTSARYLAVERARGRRIVLANGCFDILHGGHVSYLEDARSRGDLLVLATNSNASIRRLKGEGRPVLREADRLEVLSSLRCVDRLTVFHKDTADHILEILRPDAHAKGSDYTPETVPERETDLRLGIEIVICGGAKENNTREIVGKMR